MGEPNNRILKADAKIEDACKTLIEHAHNQGTQLILVNSTYRQRPKGTIHSVKVDGVEIGYRRTAYPRFMRREVIIKVPGYTIEDLSKEERDAILTAVFNVFLIPGAAIPQIFQPKGMHDTIAIWQDFVPMVPVERSPGLVSIAGGFNA